MKIQNQMENYLIKMYDVKIVCEFHLVFFRESGVDLVIQSYALIYCRA